MTARGSVQFARKWGRGLSTAVGILEWSGLSRSIDFDIYIYSLIYVIMHRSLESFRKLDALNKTSMIVLVITRSVTLMLNPVLIKISFQ